MVLYIDITEQLLSALQEVAGKVAKVTYLPGRNFDVPGLYLDCSRIAEDLGWTAHVDFDDGLLQMSESMRAQFVAERL